MAGIIERTTAHAELEQEPSWTSTAYHALVETGGLFDVTPMYRWAYFDPTSSLADSATESRSPFENDALTHHTFGLNYNPEYPIRLKVQYTLALEEEGRELDNDRAEVLLQTQW